MEAKTETLLREWGKWIRIGRPDPKGAKSWLGVMVDRLVQQNRGEGMILADERIRKRKVKRIELIHILEAIQITTYMILIQNKQDYQFKLLAPYETILEALQQGDDYE